jgi:hypothetical protein
MVCIEAKRHKDMKAINLVMDSLISNMPGEKSVGNLKEHCS